MLSAANLVYRVAEATIVDGISAEFEPGRLHLIMGPNGAGKSTLVKLLSRLLRVTNGQILYGTEEISRFKDRELARRRAILSQAVEVAFSMPVDELVLMGRYPHFRGRPAPTDAKICEEVMEFFGIADMAERSYGTLSGGEKQRVQFARVLAQIWRPLPDSARYLFLDEPLTFLDIRHQLDCMRKVQEFASQMDVVAIGVVHDLGLAAKFADRVILLHKGRVIADGPANSVLTVTNLNTAFGVTPTLLTNPADGRVHFTFD